jgi:translocation protein SEC62
LRLINQSYIGKRGIDALLSEGYKKVTKSEKAPNTREEAFAVFNDLGKFGFILRVDRGESIEIGRAHV